MTNTRERNNSKTTPVTAAIRNDQRLLLAGLKQLRKDFSTSRFIRTALMKFADELAAAEDHEMHAVIDDWTTTTPGQRQSVEHSTKRVFNEAMRTANLPPYGRPSDEISIGSQGSNLARHHDPERGHTDEAST